MSIDNYGWLKEIYKNIDFDKFKKKEIKKAEAEFKEKYGDEFEKSPTPIPSVKSSHSSESEEEKKKELTPEEKAQIGEYFKKRLEEHLRRTNQNVKLLPKLRNNTVSNMKNFIHHVAISAPKLGLPDSIPNLFQSQ